MRHFPGDSGAQSRDLFLSTGCRGKGQRKGVCEFSRGVAMTQQDWEDMEGSREGALWLEFLTWVGGQRDTGTGGVTAGVGCRCEFPPGDRGL